MSLWTLLLAVLALLSPLWAGSTADVDLPDTFLVESPHQMDPLPAHNFGRMYSPGSIVQYVFDNRAANFYPQRTEQGLFPSLRLGSFFSRQSDLSFTLFNIPETAVPTLMALPTPELQQPMFAWQDRQLVYLTWQHNNHPYSFDGNIQPVILAVDVIAPTVARILVDHEGAAVLLHFENNIFSSSKLAVEPRSATAGLPGNLFLATPSSWYWLQEGARSRATSTSQPILDMAATRFLTADPDRMDLVIVTPGELQIYIGLGPNNTWLDLLTSPLSEAQDHLLLHMVPRVPHITLPTGYLHLVHQSTKALWRVNYHPTRLLWQRVRAPGHFNPLQSAMLPVSMANARAHPPELWLAHQHVRVFPTGPLFGCTGADPSIVCDPATGSWKCAPGRVYAPLASPMELCAACADGFHAVALSPYRYDCRPCPGDHCRACVAGVCTACMDGYLLRRTLVNGAPSAQCVSICGPGYQPAQAECQPDPPPSRPHMPLTRISQQADKNIAALTPTRMFHRDGRLYLSRDSLSAREPGGMLAILQTGTFAMVDVRSLASDLTAPLQVHPLERLPSVSSVRQMFELGPLRQGDTIRLVLLIVLSGQQSQITFECHLPLHGEEDECPALHSPLATPASSLSTQALGNRISPTVVSYDGPFHELRPDGSLIKVEGILTADQRTSAAMAIHTNPATGQPVSWVYQYIQNAGFVAHPWDLVSFGDARTSTKDWQHIQTHNPPNVMPLAPAVSRHPVGTRSGTSTSSTSPRQQPAPPAGRPAAHSSTWPIHMLNSGIVPSIFWRPMALASGSRPHHLPQYDLLLTGIALINTVPHWLVIHYPLGMEPQQRTRQIAGSPSSRGPLPLNKSTAPSTVFHAQALHLQGYPEYPSALVVLHRDFFGVLLLHCPLGHAVCQLGPSHMSTYPAGLSVTEHTFITAAQLPQSGSLSDGQPAAAAFLIVSRSNPSSTFLLQVAPEACPLGTYAPECGPCHEDCQACHGPLATDCSQPGCNFFLPADPATCLPVCPPGLHRHASGACLCRADCAACSAPEVGESVLCTACPSGMALDPSDPAPDRCLACHSTCSQCAAPGSPTACLACSDDRAYRQPNGSCAPAAECPPGYWPHEHARACEPCPAGCSTCADAFRCTACRQGFLLEATMGVCFECVPGCASCDSQPNRCLSCQPGLLLLPDSGTCVSTCPASTAPNATATACHACHASCATCTHPGSPIACLTCPGATALQPDGRTCATDCPMGFRLADGRCVPCDSGCIACSTPGTCDQCDARRFDAGDGSCSVCHSACLTCTSASACTACQPGLVFLSPDALLDSLCTSTCDPGDFPGPGRCHACHRSCALCSGAPDACEVCAPGFHRPPGWLSGAGPCMACPAGCTSCTSSMCLSCEGHLFLTHDGRCVASCPAGAFGQPALAACQPCDATCADCAGPSADECTACIPGLEQVPRPGGLLACESPCLEGHFRDDSSMACLPCHEACAECNGPTDENCWRCQDHLLQGSTCVQECAPQHVPMAGRCLPCHVSCHQCTGIRSTDCTGTCRSDLLALPAGQGPMRCVSACPAGHRTTEDGCVACGDNCTTCPVSADVCAQCNRGWFLFPADTCDSPCPEGTSPWGGLCSPCHGSCATCYGPDPGHCLTCHADESVMLDHRCLASCPEGFFPDHGQCAPCHTACAACHGPDAHQCTACKSGHPLTLRGTCEPACPAGQFAIDAGPDQRLCQPCHEGCLMCDGPTAGHCTACREGQLLEQTRCTEACSEGHFPCPDVRRCLACPPDCTSCFHDAASPDTCAARCTACRAGLMLSLVTEQCQDTCPPGEVFDVSPIAPQATCARCAPRCATCHPSPDHCTACANEDDWLQVATGECLPACPAVQYASHFGQRVCLPCPAECEQCTVSAMHPGCQADAHGLLVCREADSCDRCAPNSLLLQGNACVSKCPAGFFDHWDAPVPACGPCHSSCLGECFGPSRDECTNPRPAVDHRLALGLGVGLGLLLLLLLLALAICLLWRLRRAPAPKPSDDPDENSTVLNTLVELSLPGAIQVDLGMDFTPIDTALGTGAQATVFAARAVGAGISARLNCPDIVAIKQLKATTMTPRHVALFQNEIALMWLLRHQDHIVQLFGYSESPPGIVMERFHSDLGVLLHSEVELSLHTRLDLALQWATGLEAMHGHGVAHCDLKPANVFVSPDGSAWRAALGDFGTSRNLSDSRSSALVSHAPELNAMTARYAAPEVLVAFQRRRPVEANLYLPADIYAAALLLWETIARRVPWEDGSFMSIAESVTAGRRPELHHAADPVTRVSPSLGQNLLDTLPLLWAPEAPARPPAASLRHLAATLVTMLPDQ
ncbi:serine/threonine protein kinase [Fonticula alba]|uniref:Serine/threonine protein kinase n=1 Tax=Fonticula alba TaxID=691883 RepID=A0A058Z4C1_FONAL|nr:serine/threonine protein kinase [Fonticula alba]KCV68773.1 serine/threonine protein kinase [Fonticula alba]|eukprot:XP_009497205.1 serine/threonine protein kinase [Fonticula alba]